MKNVRIGCFVCAWGVNIGGTIDVKAVAEFAKTLSNVVYTSTSLFTCSDAGQLEIKEAIKEHNLNRIVVAACTPKIHEGTYRALLKEAGISPYYFQMVNLREQDSFVHTDKEAATEKAKHLVAAGVARAELLEDIPVLELETVEAVMVVGAGITGMTAALALAKQGIKVYLVESSPSIGGSMAKFDRVFPTDDCSIWILAPKMVEVARNPNIEILTYTEVQGVSGRPGEFKVELLQNARYVNTETCTGCEACLEKCPIIVPNEFNNGLGTRGAIYVLFAQAVPKIAVINKEDCIECGACQKACLSQSIDLEQQPKTKEIEVGAIIVATGFAPYDASENNDYGYGIYENVVTQSDLERLLNPTGPTSGHLVRISDSKTPNKIAMVQCVGSRDLKTNPHCSQVCCMVAMKNAQLIKQEYPDADITIYYIDIRTPDKACEEYYARVRDAGIKFVRGKIAEVKENKETKNLKIRVENTLTRELIRDEVDMLVLSAGIVPGEGTLKIAEILRLDRGPSGFLKPIHECLSPQNTKAPGIYIGGGAHGPKNIPYSVAGANGVAALAAAFVQGKIMLELMVPVVNESLCISCGTCERVCPFNAVEVIDEVAQVSEVACTGCGLCVSVCPTKALSVRYHRDEQILREISGTLKPTLKVKT